MASSVAASRHPGPSMNELVTDTAKPPDEEVNEAGGFAFDPNVGIVRGVEPLTGPTREA